MSQKNKHGYTVLNSRLPRIDAPAKATGQALFTDDISLPGMLFGAVLQSPIAHGHILNIDTSKAEGLPGVTAVITHEDAGPIKYGVSPARYDETIFCIDKVRYVGDEIAAVAAVDQETAQEALALIKVDYEELPVLLDPFEAMAKGAPLIHEDFLRNITAEVHQEFGDVEDAFAEADYIREDRFVNDRLDAAFLEPQACIATYDTFGNLTLTSSTQTPHYVQRTIAMTLSLPLHKVRVKKPYVGGGFGIKAAGATHEMSASILAMKTGKPVKIVFDRKQVFLYGRARHQFFVELKTGVKRDGTVCAVQNKTVLDGGAYTSFGIATVYYAGSLLGAPYRIKAMKYDGYRVYTNKPACGAHRGHGGVANRAAFEQQLDAIAKELGIDPIELRLKNVMEAGETTINQLYLSSFGMRECIEAVRENSAWGAKKGKLPRGRGIGMACGFFVSGAGYPIYRTEMAHSHVFIKVVEDGNGLTVFTGSGEIGQGSDTTMAMIAAEVMGLQLEDVRVVSGDTELTPVDLGAYSSRQTLMTGWATKRAAEDARSQIAAVVGDLFKVDPEILLFQKGQILGTENPSILDQVRRAYIGEHRGFQDRPSGRSLTFREGARLAFNTQGIIIGRGFYKPPKLGGEYKGAAVGTSPAYGCSALVVEVEVDMETGEVTVLDMTDAHDCGFAINRCSVEGQMQGSLANGLGEALFEAVKFSKSGEILNTTLGDYKIPTALDIPDMNAIIVESNEPNGPFGAKEVGEGAIMPVIPAILNAICDATGVRIRELPASSERILMAIRTKEENKTR
jgi:4-hydroxybenzoyl-CoA reductase subunit alpha